MRQQAIAVLVLLALVAAGCGGGESEAHKRAREDARTAAGYYCTMQPGLTSAGAIYTEEFKNCVKQETARFLSEWERAHPGE